MNISRSNISWIGLLFGAIFLASCQTTSLSPDIAASISLSLESGRIAPPPRKSDDLVRLLYSSKAPMKTKYIQRKADEEPPIQINTAKNTALRNDKDGINFPEDFNKKLYNFYLSRGEAAEIMGRQSQRVSDYEKAVELIVKNLGDNKKSEALTRAAEKLAWAYEGVGELEKALSSMFQSLNAIPANRDTEAAWNYRLYRHSGYAFLASWLGNYNSAESHIKLAKAALKIHKGQGDGTWTKWNELAESNIVRTEGRLAQSRGEYEKAEKFYRETVRLREKHDDKLDLSFARFHLAEALLLQGKFVEAETQAREGLSEMLEVGGSTFPSTGYHVFGLGNVLLATGRNEEAKLLAETALQIFSESAPLDEKSLPVSALRFTLATAAVITDDWPAAAEQANLIKQYHGGFDSPLMKAEPQGAALISLIDLKDKKYTEALTRAELSKALIIKKEGSDSQRVVGAIAMEATILEAMGRDDEALNKFKSIRPYLTGIGLDTNLNLTGLDNHINAKLWQISGDSYLRLLNRTNQDQLGNISVIEESFLVAQVMDNSATDKALIAASARSIGENSGLGQLIRALQDLQVRREAVLKALNYNLSQSGANRDDNLIAGLQLFVSDSEREITVIQSRISSEFPKYKKTVAPGVLTFSDLRRILRPGEALIATHIADEHTYVWAIPFEGEVAFTISNLGKSNIEKKVDTLRLAVNPDAKTLGDIPPFDIATSHELYKQLLEPIKHGWKNTRSLVVVADGTLGYLPFSLLVTKAADLQPEKGSLFSNYRAIPWLARSHAITNLPSVASLKILRDGEKKKSASMAFSGFGDPIFSKKQLKEANALDKKIRVAVKNLKTGGVSMVLRAAPKTALLESANLSVLPRLPDTSDEILSIADTLGANLNRDVYLREKANEETVKSKDLSDYRVIAFATHGLISGDLDGLSQPALAFSDPSLTNDQVNDGLLTMGEVLELKLNADWVVLSACNTASGDGTGAEAISGLGRAFFFAGTRAILVSNWPVESTSTTALTTNLFRLQADNSSLSRADALQQAMLNLIDGPGYVDTESKTAYFSYAHPIFWAPFTIVGEGGRTSPKS